MNIRKRALAGAVAVTLGSVLLSAQTRDFQPVTDAMLQKPNAGEWLHWRGTEDAWGYSPLDQINRGNVGQLQLAWSWARTTRRRGFSNSSTKCPLSPHWLRRV